MNKKILGSLMAVMSLLVIGMSTGVLGAACDATTCTTTCSWSFPSSNNYELSNTAEGNTTMVAKVEEGTTSGYYNVTTYTITPFHNSTVSQNTSDQSLGPIIWSELDDGIYTLGATIFYENASANNFNLTATQVSCSSIQFIVDTTEGSIIPALQQAVVTEEKGKTAETIAVLIVLFIAAYLIFFRKK